MGAFEDTGRFLGQLRLPLIGRDVQNAKGAPSTKPAVTHFLQIPKPVNDIPLSVFLGKVEKVDCTSSVSNVHRDIADLAEAVSAFVHSEKLGNGGSSLSAESARRDMLREWRVGLCVF